MDKAFRQALVIATLALSLLTSAAIAQTKAGSPVRVDPCNEARTRLDLISRNSVFQNDVVSLGIVGENELACANTYAPSEAKMRCQAYRMAASAYDSAARLDTDSVNERLDLAFALHAYASADGECPEDRVMIESAMESVRANLMR